MYTVCTVFVGPYIAYAVETPFTRHLIYVHSVTICMLSAYYQVYTQHVIHSSVANNFMQHTYIYIHICIYIYMYIYTYF